MRQRTASLWHRLTKRSLVTLVVIVVVALTAGASAWALTTGAGANYRVAGATTGNVEETLDATGTLEPVHTAQLSFQVAGQVASVAVAVGQNVTDGQVLATLDTSSLDSTVDSDQSAVTSAQTKLAQDETSEASSATSTTTTTTTTTTTPTSSSSPSASTSTGLSAAQATLTSDQHTLDTDSAQAKSDLSQATSTCAASTGSPCTTALQSELSDQQTVARDEQTVAQDESSLAALLSSSTTSHSTNATTGTDTTGTGRAGTGSSTSDSAGTTSTDTASGATPASESTAAATPYEVAADQADLDADDVVLSEAQGALDEAQLTSPMSGVVVSVSVTGGENVSADSSSEEIEVIGPQSFEVSTTVDVSDVSEVKVGEKASVTLDGQGGELSATVSEVGPPPVSSTSTDYPVVITLPAGAQGLYDGASASVAIVVGEASDVVTVPTSALHELGQLSYVDEVRNGTLDQVRVTVGAMGETTTQVTSGVKVGDDVVLANLSEPVPTNTTSGPGSFAGVGALTGTGGGGFAGAGAGGGGGFSRRGG